MAEQGRNLFEAVDRGLFLHAEIPLRLWVFLQDSTELAERLAALRHDAEDLKGGYQAVTRGSVIAEDHVAALLSADGKVSGPHRLDHVTISHRRADDLPAAGGDHFIQAQIAHHRGHESLAGQRSPPERIESRHGKEFIPVQNFPPLIAKKQTIGISVMGDSDVSLRLLHEAADLLGMGAPARPVDVHAV